MSLQTVLIPRSFFSLTDARKWMKDNGYPVKKIDKTNNYYRFRQMEPVSGAQYYTIRLNNGIDLVYQK